MILQIGGFLNARGRPPVFVDVLCDVLKPNYPGVEYSGINSPSGYNGGVLIVQQQ